MRYYLRNECLGHVDPSRAAVATSIPIPPAVAADLTWLRGQQVHVQAWIGLPLGQPTPSSELVSYITTTACSLTCLAVGTSLDAAIRAEQRPCALHKWVQKPPATMECLQQVYRHRILKLWNHIVWDRDNEPSLLSTA